MTKNTQNNANVIEQIGIAIDEHPILALTAGAAALLGSQKANSVAGVFAGLATTLAGAYCFDKAVEAGYVKHDGNQAVRKILRDFLDN